MTVPTAGNAEAISSDYLVVMTVTCNRKGFGRDGSVLEALAGQLQGCSDNGISE